MSDPDRPPLLEVDDLHVAYGKAEVVHGVSLRRARRRVRRAARAQRRRQEHDPARDLRADPEAGRHASRFDGADLSSASPREIVRAGIVQVLEGHRVFTTLSVEDNLLIGTYARSAARRPQQARADLRRCSPNWRTSADAAGLAPVRRPAADPGGGAGRHRRTAAADPRRAVRRPGADRHRPHPRRRRASCARAAWRSCWSSNWWRRRCATPTTATSIETGRIAAAAHAEELRSGDLIERVYLGHGATPA